ncbi:MFS transporter [Corynebacterium lactis]|uniref:MFS transporter permease n=1 Tax=Corynebacterium lactis RW2-5 TaxID=1408189 RepID=A0A0K2GY09_9CORY|nr:MFS transporter [Corynebacterium lactis]ALA66568.1 MFS transporter permease [Corynebacterium lactis RW2-5]
MVQQGAGALGGGAEHSDHGEHGQRKVTRFWLFSTIAVFAVAWGGNQFTPLMVMYRLNRDLPPVFVDLLLFVYALGIAPALLISGPLSDRIGRKPVMLAAPFLSIIGSTLIAIGEKTGPLILSGRFISGIAVGIVMAVGGSWVKELSTERFDPTAKPTSGAKRQSMALTLGFGIGAGVAGTLAQFAPMPGQLAYIVHICLTIPTALGMMMVPETRQSPHLQGGHQESLLQSLRTPSVTNRRFLLVVAMGAPWVFGAAGVAYAIIPSLMQNFVSQPVFYSAMVTFFALLLGFGIQQIGPRLVSNHSAKGSLIAMGIVIVGMGAAAWMSTNPTAVTAFVAALILGMGYGLSMFTGLNEVQRIAGPRDLAGLTGIFYCLTYIGFAFPAILTELSHSISWMTYPVMLGGGMVIALAMSAVIYLNSRVNLPQKTELA